MSYEITLEKGTKLLIISINQILNEKEQKQLLELIKAHDKKNKTGIMIIRNFDENSSMVC